MGPTIFKLKLVPSTVSNSRQAICDTCNHKKTFLNRCGKCGCFLFFKTKLLDAQCPLKYWGNPRNTWGGF
jgi:hypothetical protein